MPPCSLAALAREVERRLAALEIARWPDRVRASTPEGYAWYGLHPETYVAAAATARAELRPARAVCVGLRSIVTSLSAAVTGELVRLGCAVSSCTLRPRGAPFERELRIGPRLAAWLGRRAAGTCLIVDEGPGISGSSFCATAGALELLGFARQRIVLFPSRRVGAAHLRSPAARRRWPMHARFTGSFESVWLASGRLFSGAQRPRDLSAGR